jgi:type II secretory pathway pseudopilin PulG
MKERVKHYSRPGFVLLAMLLVLVLLGIFGLVASEVFLSSMKWIQRSEASQTQAARFESLVRRLRADAWGAAEVQVVSASEVKLGNIVWKIIPDGSLNRSSSKDGAQHWPPLNAALAFASAPRGLALRVSEKGNQEELVLPSQVLLWGAKP